MKRSSQLLLRVTMILALGFASFPRWLPLLGASSPTTAPAGDVAPTSPPTLLEGTLAPLADRFNKDNDKPRVLALLSPT